MAVAAALSSMVVALVTDRIVVAAGMPARVIDLPTSSEVKAAEADVSVASRLVVAASA